MPTRLCLTGRKVKETGEVDSEGEPVQLSDIEKEGDGGVGDEGSGGRRPKRRALNR